MEGLLGNPLKISRPATCKSKPGQRCNVSVSRSVACIHNLFLQEARWLQDSQVVVHDQRVAQARDLRQREQDRKAEMFGADTVYRTQKPKGPIVPLPQLLVDTRAEHARARKESIHKSDPKKYQFLHETLVALEKRYAQELRQARERAYHQNRAKLRLTNLDAETEEEDVETLASRVTRMSEEEFKELALERKQRANADIASHTLQKAHNK